MTKGPLERHPCGFRASQPITFSGSATILKKLERREEREREREREKERERERITNGQTDRITDRQKATVMKFKRTFSVPCFAMYV